MLRSLILMFTLAGGFAANTSPVANRLTLRSCADALALNVWDDFALRCWLRDESASILGEVSHVSLSHLRRLTPEIAGRRALAVDEILERLSEQANGHVADVDVRRRSWQLRILAEGPARPRGLALVVLGDRLRWDRELGRPIDGEFVLALSWEQPAPATLVELLPDLVHLAHRTTLVAEAPLRMLRAGDPLDGELYVLVDVGGDAVARLSVAISLLAQVRKELAEVTELVDRP